MVEYHSKGFIHALTFTAFGRHPYTERITQDLVCSPRQIHPRASTNRSESKNTVKAELLLETR